MGPSKPGSSRQACSVWSGAPLGGQLVGKGFVGGPGVNEHGTVAVTVKTGDGGWGWAQIHTIGILINNQVRMGASTRAVAKFE